MDQSAIKSVCSRKWLYGDGRGCVKVFLINDKMMVFLSSIFRYIRAVFGGIQGNIV